VGDGSRTVNVTVFLVHRLTLQAFSSKEAVSSAGTETLPFRRTNWVVEERVSLISIWVASPVTDQDNVASGPPFTTVAGWIVKDAMVGRRIGVGVGAGVGVRIL
jgi:hypothetical protein